MLQPGVQHQQIEVNVVSPGYRVAACSCVKCSSHSDSSGRLQAIFCLFISFITKYVPL